jgi:proline iminopeptidase
VSNVAVRLLSSFRILRCHGTNFAERFASACAVVMILLVQPETRAQSVPEGPRVEEGYFKGPDYVKLFYRRLGEGNEFVVFLHGGPGADIHDGGYLMDPLARGRVLIMYDQRGNGRSDLVSRPELLTADTEVRDLEALRRHFGIEKMSLVGLSWGSGLAALYTAAHPNRVSRIVFLSPMPVANRPFVEEREKKEKSLLSKEQADRLHLLEEEMKTASDDRISALCTEHDRISYGIYLVHPEKMPDDCCNICTLSPAAIRNSALVFKAVVSSLGDFDFRPTLRRITVPALVIEGANSIVPLDSTREWANAPPHSRLLLIPHAGHANFVDQTDAVLNAIQVFLRGAWPPGAMSLDLRHVHYEHAQTAPHPHQ